MSNEDKKHLGIVICGHVDAGKSTTTGHLLFELGGINDREIAKLKAEAEAIREFNNNLRPVLIESSNAYSVNVVLFASHGNNISRPYFH